MRIFKPADLGVGVRLAATGSYLPEQVVTNAELVAQGAPLTEEEIVKLSGILTRHRAGPEQAASDLAVAACRGALARAGLEPGAVDRLILGTVSGDYPSPSTACAVQHALGLGQVPAFDVSAACSGFVFAVELAARCVATGDRHVLAVAADVRSRYVSPTDRATCALFGDGAAAAIVSRAEVGQGLVALAVASDGRGVHSVYVPAGGSRERVTEQSLRDGRHHLRMADGPQVYFQAVEGMLETAEGLLGALDLSLGDVDLVVPHQANRRLLDRLTRVAGLPGEKVFTNVERVGNTSGASCGIALDEALTQRRVKAGARLLLLAAGAGYTAGAALLVVDDALLEAAARPCRKGAGGGAGPGL